MELSWCVYFGSPRVVSICRPKLSAQNSRTVNWCDHSNDSSQSVYSTSRVRFQFSEMSNGTWRCDKWNSKVIRHWVTQPPRCQVFRWNAIIHYRSLLSNENRVCLLNVFYKNSLDVAYWGAVLKQGTICLTVQTEEAFWRQTVALTVSTKFAIFVLLPGKLIRIWSFIPDIAVSYAFHKLKSDIYSAWLEYILLFFRTPLLLVFCGVGKNRGSSLNNRANPADFLANPRANVGKLQWGDLPQIRSLRVKDDRNLRDGSASSSSAATDQRNDDVLTSHRNKTTGLQAEF